MNSEPPTQLSPVCPFHTRQLNKLAPLVHDRHLAPRHGSPPWPSNPCHDDVSVMSPNTCRGCLRAVHLSRPSTSCLPTVLKRRDARPEAGHPKGRTHCVHFLKSSSFTSGSFFRNATTDQISGSSMPVAP